MMKPKMLKGPLLLSSLALAIGSGAAASTTQDNRDDAASEALQLAQSTQQESVEFTDEKIEAFVQAREQVVEISKKWEDRLSNAESQEELRSLQQESQEEMVEAVRDEGISVNEYNLIVDATQTDEGLRKRVNEMMTQ